VDEVDDMQPLTLERLMKVIAEQLVIDIAHVKPEARLDADLGIQSVDFIKIVSEIEDEYDMEFEDVDLDEIRTVADAHRVLSAQVQGTA
jgi:acyl carrier protein